MLRYTDDDPRDRRLDWIRGYAMFAMSVNHFGLDQSAFRFVTGGAVFLINAAEVFFFVSGVTLGLIASRRPILDGVSRCYRRAWQIYLCVLVLALAGPLMEGELPGGAERLGAVLTLREAPFWGDVLVAYVLYMLAAPPLLLLLHRGRWRLAAGIVGGIYLLSQLDPEGLQPPFASFRNLAANAPIFLGGLILGWRREAAHRWRARSRLGPPIDAAVVAIAVGLLAMYVTDYRWAPRLGDWLERYHMGAREAAMPPGALLIVGVYLRAIWLLVDRGWRVLSVGLGWLVHPLGRSALTAYVAHGLLMPAAWMLLDAAGAGLDPETVLGATAITGVYVGLVWSAVRIKQLAEAGGRRLGGRAAWASRRALGASVAALGAAAVLGTPAAEWGRRHGDREHHDEHGEVMDWVFGELAWLDGPRGALVVRPMHEPPGREPGVLAELLAEVMINELGPRSAPSAVLFVLDVGWLEDEADALAQALDDAGAPATLAPPDEIGAAAGADVVVAVTSPHDGFLGALEGVFTAAREARPDVLLIAVVRFDEHRPN